LSNPNEGPPAQTGAIKCVEQGSFTEFQQPIPPLDRPMWLKDAAMALGVRYHVVQRAARRGLVPTYRLGTSRPYVKLRDFLELMTRETNA
jgi:hypothetical protein